MRVNMTEDEDLKRDIEYLKKEIEKLRVAKRDDHTILKWLSLGEIVARVYVYLKKGKTAAEITSLTSMNPVTLSSLAVMHVFQALVKLLK
jgi:hypothetical protein